jgi:MtN3 and saliva related transmembrane protein
MDGFPEHVTEAIGWASSIVLILTLAQQNWRQWKSGSSEGVSRWLFVGQTLASLGFVTYSFLLDNWVFVVTNGLLLVNGFVGIVIVRLNKRRRGTTARA